MRANTKNKTVTVDRLTMAGTYVVEVSRGCSLDMFTMKTGPDNFASMISFVASGPDVNGQPKTEYVMSAPQRYACSKIGSEGRARRSGERLARILQSHLDARGERLEVKVERDRTLTGSQRWLITQVNRVAQDLGVN